MPNPNTEKIKPDQIADAEELIGRLTTLTDDQRRIVAAASAAFTDGFVAGMAAGQTAAKSA